MAKTEQNRKSKNEEDRQLSRELERQLTKELEMSFPASDPPAATQPGTASQDPRPRFLKRGPPKMKDKPARPS